MTVLTTNQQYHLILADIAMAAAIKTYDRGYIFCTGSGGYTPGCIRDSWLTDTTDKILVKRVSSMAQAGIGALQGISAEQLAQAAERYGVPLADGQAEAISQHFVDKRDAMLTYRR